jgi:hypothetical protein
MSDWRGTFGEQKLAAFEREAGALSAELGYSPPDVSEASSPADRIRRRATSLADRARRRLRRRAPAVIRSWRDYYERERLANRGLGALLDGRVDELAGMMEPDALVRIVSAGREQSARGPLGIDLLRATVAGGALAGRQVAGDSFPGVPTVGFVLAFEREGSTAGATVFLTVGDGRVTDVAIFLAPPGGGR